MNTTQYLVMVYDYSIVAPHYHTVVIVWIHTLVWSSGERHGTNNLGKTSPIPQDFGETKIAQCTLYSLACVHSVLYCILLFYCTQSISLYLCVHCDFKLETKFETIGKQVVNYLYWGTNNTLHCTALNCTALHCSLNLISANHSKQACLQSDL
jgi:hypothetical protein